MATKASERHNSWLALSNDLANAVEQVGRSVVAVNGRPRTPSSGVLWRPGVVVTADHTLRREEELTVTTADGRTAPATLAGRDAGTDLAVLKLDSGDTPAAETGDAGSLKAGSLVLAVGRRAPGDSGDGGFAASLGVVSGVGGTWRTWRGGQIDRLLRLDLGIFLGFSGGPLVEAQGRVVGVNTTGLTRGAGVTIPASTVDRVAASLLEKGHVARAYLGLGMIPLRLPEELKTRLGLPSASGMIVLTVEPGGPAHAAGALLGDVLVALDGAPVSDLDDVHAALSGERVGETVRAQVVRGGASKDLEITLADRPAARA